MFELRTLFWATIGEVLPGPLDGAEEHRLEAYATLRRRVVTPGARRELPGWL